MEAPNVQRTPSSSVIAAISYDPATQTLEVEFRSGRVYHYFDVPPEVFDELRHAESVGSYFNQEIRTNYHTREVARDK